MDAKHERQRGLEVGRRWAECTSSHNLATVATASFDDVAELLPQDASDRRLASNRAANCASPNPWLPSPVARCYEIEPLLHLEH